MHSPMKVLFVAAEMAPFAKVGGLADVVGSLPMALRAMGHDVRAILPRYTGVNEGKYQLSWATDQFGVPTDDHMEPALLQECQWRDIPVYFVESGRYFQREAVYGYDDDIERFVFFCRAVTEGLRRLNWVPDVFHCHDWHTAVVPYLLKTSLAEDPFFKGCGSVFTIHNLAYQGILEQRFLAITGLDGRYLRPRAGLSAGVFDLMSQGVHYADMVNTVSETYSREILTPEFGEGLDSLLKSKAERLRGILNGIDYQELDSARDPNIAVNYDATCLERKIENKRALQREMGLEVSDHSPLIGMVSRLADQKGFDLVASIVDPLMRELRAQMVILGTGDQHYHELFRSIASKYSGCVGLSLSFDPRLAQRIYAGADMFLMPSRFEPCGLGQLIAMRYGTVPVVREVGGLADSVKNLDPATGAGTGFTFKSYDHYALLVALTRAVETFHRRDTWRMLMLQGMAQNHSWDVSAHKYVDLYDEALEHLGPG